MQNQLGSYLKAYTNNTSMPAIIFATLIISQTLLFTSPEIGVYASQAALATLLLIGLVNEPLRRLALSAAILPVVNGCIILFNNPDAIAQTIILYEALFLTSLIYVYLLANNDVQVRNELKVKNYFQILPLIIIAGISMGTLGYMMPGTTGDIKAEFVLPLAGLALFQAITEELYFRGLLQKYAQKTIHPLTALLLTAITFTLFSAHVFTWQIAVFASLSSIVLSLVYYYKRSLILTMTLNASMKLTILAIVFTHAA